MGTQFKTEKSQMTMTTGKTCKIKIFMAGTGMFTIDWGDDSEIEVHTLLVYDEDLNDNDKRGKFAFRRNYSVATCRTVTITGNNITHLVCNGNHLTGLDVSRNTALTGLACGDNHLSSLDMSMNTALTGLVCGNNQLTSLDLIHNTDLTGLICGNNHLAALDVSKNTALTWLDCTKNQLTSLDVSKNTALIGFECGDNQLTSIDVSSNIELRELQCYDNQLTSLDVSHNKVLRELLCYDNQLSSLDVSNNTALLRLDCHSNLLKSLDVSTCTVLRQLTCHSNQLTSVYDMLSQIVLRLRDVRTVEIEHNKYAILFPMYKIDGGMFEIFLVEDSGRFYLSDEGATYAELDKIFELEEPDVIKNLVAIMKLYGCRKHLSSNAFTIECTPQDVHIKAGFLIQTLSFMLNMKLFYI